jgi:hypothetical protein
LDCSLCWAGSASENDEAWGEYGRGWAKTSILKLVLLTTFNSTNLFFNGVHVVVASSTMATELCCTLNQQHRCSVLYLVNSHRNMQVEVGRESWRNSEASGSNLFKAWIFVRIGEFPPNTKDKMHLQTLDGCSWPFKDNFID